MTTRVTSYQVLVQGPGSWSTYWSGFHTAQEALDAINRDRHENFTYSIERVTVERVRVLVSEDGEVWEVKDA